MPDIFDLVNATAFGAFVTNFAYAEEPLLGSTLFAKKIIARFAWSKVISKLCVLRPSALGAEHSLETVSVLPSFNMRSVLPREDGYQRKTSSRASSAKMDN